ncbi:terminase [Trueperella pyogenes]|uniref:terminase n=1 Tax=Trueperella pyogenes TaxID=1661 RepID=UPI00345D9839
MTAAPKYATARNHDNPTLGGVVDYISQAVRGKKLMPWQRLVADVACELDPNHPGEFRYSDVIVSVPRQAGKSDLLGAIHTHRLIAYKKHLAVMTAQRGRDAGKRWRKIVDDIPDEDLEKRFKVNRGKGSEEILYKATGSRLSPFAPVANAIHGDSLNFATIDEAWAYSQVQGADIEAAVKPTFLTVPNSQLWIVSTRGTANSAYLNEKIAIGRTATKDPGSKIAYFEWSADEEAADADPYSDQTLAFHPAIGYTQTARKIRELGAGKDSASRSEWRRAYLNLPTETTETALDLAVWDSLRWNYDAEAPTVRPRPAVPYDMVIAFDVALDGSSATIAAAWLNEDDDPETAIVATAPGTGWLRPTLLDLKRAGYRAIVADETGPNQTIIDDIGADLQPTIYRWAEYQRANQTFLDRFREGTITHDGNAAITDAIKGATFRTTQKGRVLDASKSVVAVDALKATIIAQYAAREVLQAQVIQIF